MDNAFLVFLEEILNLDVSLDENDTYQDTYLLIFEFELLLERLEKNPRLTNY